MHLWYHYKLWCMKNVLLFLWLAFSALAAEAQKKNKTAKRSVAKKEAAKKPATVATLPSNTITLSHSSDYKAFADRAAVRRLYIADTTLRVLDRNAAGANLRISGSGIVGRPRGSYGFSNGQFILYGTHATSTGTITGSGSVGTGSSPASIGTFGPGMGVNGKNPYAGPEMYGTGVYSMRDIILIDSTRKSGIRRQ